MRTTARSGGRASSSAASSTLASARAGGKSRIDDSGARNATRGGPGDPNAAAADADDYTRCPNCRAPITSVITARF